MKKKKVHRSKIGKNHLGAALPFDEDIVDSAEEITRIGEIGFALFFQ